MTSFPQPENWLEHRVSYGETDSMGVMYYAEYFHLFERGRNAFIHSRGISYREVEQRGVLLPVREAQCRYRVSARFDDLLRVRVGVSVWGRASMTFVYEVHCENRLLATGATQHACVSPEGRPVAAPAWLRDIIFEGSSGAAHSAG